MAGAQNGDTVKVHFTGSLDDGTVFDSSLESAPLEFTLGDTLLIPGFQDIIRGMNPGDTKKETLSPDEAYGPRHKELIIQVNRQHLPQGLEPQIGQHLQLARTDGDPVSVLITEINEDAVTLDANHPLAGLNLIFEVELLDIA